MFCVYTRMFVFIFLKVLDDLGSIMFLESWEPGFLGKVQILCD